jgi:hypothetical protein
MARPGGGLPWMWQVGLLAVILASTLAMRAWLGPRVVSDGFRIDSSAVVVPQSP